MTSLPDLFDLLWKNYLINPQVQAVRELLESRGESVVNDHLAFRTFNHPKIGINALAASFLKLGYQAAGEYEFHEKKLTARHFEHPDSTLPRIFISELLTEEFSDSFRSLVQGLIDQVPADAPDRWDFPAMGRPWSVSYAEYETLRSESEYAAWLSAFGFCANHFTVLVNALTSVDSLEELNALLKQNGFTLNESGGEIKGSPELFLEQSSTRAGEVSVQFSDGQKQIPGCYYEFAYRYAMPNGKLFQGFVVKSADKIFESTDKNND